MPAKPLRQDRLEARISPDQKQVLVQAAELLGQTLTEFVVGNAMEAALRVVRQNELIEWTARDQRAFATALSEPPAPAAKLRAAARRYRDETAGRG